MDWQQITALMIVAAAGILLLGGRVRRRKAFLQCDSHCGCAGAEAGISRNTIIYRARKGQRPEVRVKIK